MPSRKFLILFLTSFIFCYTFAFFIFPPVRKPIALFSLVFSRLPVVLPVPVQGVWPAQLKDTWGALRSEGRHHEGIDIFARRWTPVLSTTSGLIYKVGLNRLGGKIVMVLGPRFTFHYYAHLEGYGEIHPGQRVSQGDVLGYVGDSGNAKGTPTHLHYGIYRWYGRAVNPYLLLQKTE